MKDFVYKADIDQNWIEQNLKKVDQGLVVDLGCATGRVLEIALKI